MTALNFSGGLKLSRQHSAQGPVHIPAGGAPALVAASSAVNNASMGVLSSTGHSSPSASLSSLIGALTLSAGSSDVTESNKGASNAQASPATAPLPGPQAPSLSAGSAASAAPSSPASPSSTDKKGENVEELENVPSRQPLRVLALWKAEDELINHFQQNPGCTSKNPAAKGYAETVIRYLITENNGDSEATKKAIQTEIAYLTDQYARNIRIGSAIGSLPSASIAQLKATLLNARNSLLV